MVDSTTSPANFHANADLELRGQGLNQKCRQGALTGWLFDSGAADFKRSRASFSMSLLLGFNLGIQEFYCLVALEAMGFNIVQRKQGSNADSVG